MPSWPTDRPPADADRAPVNPRADAFAEVLAAHVQACAEDQPLLTSAGLVYLRHRLLACRRWRDRPEADAAASGAAGAELVVPYWDAAMRRLWLGTRLLKEFRQPAVNQTTLLDVFEELGWSVPHIDDPLSLAVGETEPDAKRRLHETIKNLNRSLPRGSIHFRGDGTGQGVIWEVDHQLVATAGRRSGRPRP